MAYQSELCAVCQTNPGKTIMTAACGHHFCPWCLAKAYRASSKTTAMPARCCGECLPYNDEVYDILMDLWYCHYDDPEMIYCANKRCGRYKRPHIALRSAERCSYCFKPACGKCTRLAHDRTCRGCTDCKKRSHLGVCNDGSGELLRLAWKKMWMQCPKCRMMVEQIDGDWVVSCLCGADFCYRCGRNMTGRNWCFCKLTGKAAVLRTWRKVRMEVSILVSPKGPN